MSPWRLEILILSAGTFNANAALFFNELSEMVLLPTTPQADKVNIINKLNVYFI
ncbi:conserved hypothetical protein [Aggregatibacter segnis ATCC 33393]|uniref:Uncharacterized protein n=1 Tax=Aggregatibacter segnis ATCC 33393 TaxID=888057 RepID=E6KXL0_9PAST|nr:conserved hypothetical protein [Aggregatibacter segnis ATCC 33393]